MNKVNFIPAENKVLIRAAKQETSKGGIILDKAVANEASIEGIVHASNALGYEDGDKILFNKFAAIEISLGKQGKYLLASKEAILGKITE